MKLNPIRAAKKNEDRLISLINIVFLLLIFFMLTGRIEKKEIIPIVLPQTTTLQQNKPQTLTILIDKHDHYYFQDERLSADEVIERLGIQQKEKGDRGELVIAIRADAAIHNKTLNQLLTVLAKAGFSRIQLLVRGV